MRCDIISSRQGHERWLSEALYRAEEFARRGADILFVEAPKNEDEMRQICSVSSLPHMANIVEGGETPDLPNAALQDLGNSIAVYPLPLMVAAMQAMVTTLRSMRENARPGRMEFDELRRRIGFHACYGASSRYTASARDT